MRRLAILVVGALLLVSAGCSVAPEKTASVVAVETAVRAYNAALVTAFAEMDMNELNAVATEEQAATEFPLMAALGEGRVRMLSTLTSIEFGDVAFSGDSSATVTTTETWDYRHESLDTSETVREEKGIVYHLRYNLVLQDERWLVDVVAPLDTPTGSKETTP